MATLTPPRDLLIRAAALYGPMAITALLWTWRRPDRRLAAAALLGCAWNVPALLAVNTAAIAFGWWRFTAADGVFAGMPVDLYLGWILLWGAAPILAWPAPRLPAAIAALVAIDLAVMPACAPVVALGPRWLIGEAAAVAIALAPSLCLAAWTASGRHTARRAALQAVAFTGLMLYAIPSAVFAQIGGTWHTLLGRPLPWTNAWAQLLAVPAVVGLSAVQEFAMRGRGTPLPFDPPARLVVTGPYAYVANPMQLSMSLVLVVWAAMLGSWWIAAGVVVAVAYSAGLAAWHEDEELAARYGAAWTDYRRRVRRWRPRWRPADRPLPDRLYVAQSCGICRDVGHWLLARGPIGVDIVAAETFPGRDLRRITYVSSVDGHEDEGVAAVARTLERANLAWAWLGMLIRLPIVRPFLQLVVDASGGQPRSCRSSGLLFLSRRSETRHAAPATSTRYRRY